MGNARAIAVRGNQPASASRKRWRIKFVSDPADHLLEPDDGPQLVACQLVVAPHRDAPPSYWMELAYIDKDVFDRVGSVPGSYERERDEFWRDFITKFYHFVEIDGSDDERLREEDRLIDWVARRIPLTERAAELRRRWRKRSARGEFQELRRRAAERRAKKV